MVCSRRFIAKRLHAQTCSDACRARKSRRKRDPDIGSSGRRRNQLEGLDKKYTYRQRAQARHELRLLGIVPREWVKGTDGEWSPQFSVSSQQRRLHGFPGNNNVWSWSPADSFPPGELFIGFRDAARPAPGWHRGPYWPPELSNGRNMPTPEELGRVFAALRIAGADFANGFLGGHVPQGEWHECAAFRVVSDRPDDVYEEFKWAAEHWSAYVAENPVRIIARGSWWDRLARKLPEAPATFPCEVCGRPVSVKRVLSHKCRETVTRHTKRDRGLGDR